MKPKIVLMVTAFFFVALALGYLFNHMAPFVELALVIFLIYMIIDLMKSARLKYKQARAFFHKD